MAMCDVMNFFLKIIFDQNELDDEFMKYLVYRNV
jgi:hypothetical protein